MARMTAGTLAIALLASLAFAQGTARKRDQKAVEQVIDNWNRAWQTKDAKLAAQDYASIIFIPGLAITTYRSFCIPMRKW